MTSERPQTTRIPPPARGGSSTHGNTGAEAASFLDCREERDKDTPVVEIRPHESYLDREHVEVDLILPKRRHPLALEAIVRESCELESSKHFGLDE